MNTKSRLVPKGYAQRKGVDFFGTKSPCLLIASIRLLAVIACELDLDLRHFDAERAFN